MEKKITVYENYLDEVLFNECFQYSYYLFNSNNKNNDFNINYRLNLTYWNNDIVHDSAPIYIIDINNNNELYKKISKTIEEKNNKKIKCIMFYFYSSISHIPWHTDSKHNGGITIYLNKNWDKNSGGLFLYETENEIKAIVPKKNLAIEQFGGVPHSVSPTSMYSDIRRTIQIFF